MTSTTIRNAKIFISIETDDKRYAAVEICSDINIGPNLVINGTIEVGSSCELQNNSLLHGVVKCIYSTPSYADDVIRNINMIS